MAVFRGQFQGALAKTDRPQWLLHFQHRIGLVTQCLHVVRPKIQDRIVGRNLILLGGFLAGFQPKGVHFVGAFDLGLVLMNDVGFLP